MNISFKTKLHVMLKSGIQAASIVYRMAFRCIKSRTIGPTKDVL